MSDIIIAGNTYSDVPKIIVPKVGGGNAEFTEGGGTVNLVPIAVRPDATKIKTYSYDKWIVEDEEVTFPAYTTTDTTLKASEALEPTITVDGFDTSMYYVAIRMLTIPTYSVTTKGKGRVEYAWSSYLYELARQPLNTMPTIIDPTKFYASSIIAFTSCGMARLMYWSSGTKFDTYSTAGYGTVQAVTAPAYSNSTITLKSPALKTRGHTTYFTSTYMNAVTDVRYQWVIDVYKAPVGNLNIDGWGSTHNINHIIDCVASANHKLT